jgi:large subunit ribosomal protein L9
LWRINYGSYSFRKYKKLGKIGSKVKVANGFARNYLLKNNKALVASKENLAIFEKRKEELNKKITI